MIFQHMKKYVTVDNLHIVPDQQISFLELKYDDLIRLIKKKNDTINIISLIIQYVL
jgi:hypothetical protein